MVNDEFNLEPGHAAPVESPTTLPEVGIAALGTGLLALPILHAIGINYDVTPASLSAVGLSPSWQSWPGMGSLVGSVGLGLK